MSEDIQITPQKPEIIQYERGRKAKYDVTPLREAADRTGQWVSMDVTYPCALSFKRQLQRIGGYRVDFSRVDDPELRKIIVKREGQPYGKAEDQ